MIELNKEYITKSGKKVKLFEKIDELIYGIIYEKIEPEPVSWMLNGNWMEKESDNDLIEEKDVLSLWVNIYKNGLFQFKTKEDALREADDDIIACVKLTYKIGEGL